MSLPALIFPLTFHPQQSGVEPYGDGKQKAGKSSGSHALGYADKVIYGFLMVYAVCSAFLTGLPSHFTSYAETAGFAQTGALMVSACMIANTVGKIILGSMLDKAGSRLSISVYDILILGGIALMYLAISQPLLIASAFLYGLCYSLNTIAITFIIREMFGVEMFSKTYPKLSLMVSLSSAVSTTVVGYLYDVFGSYGVILIILAAMSFTGLMMILLSHRRMKKLTARKTEAD
ncbi:MAG: MFS transporter [Erysipelotrichaceae bacterium]|nr:MFS transporter [Erysipelotrichaceae bacterium]